MHTHTQAGSSLQGDEAKRVAHPARLTHAIRPVPPRRCQWGLGGTAMHLTPPRNSSPPSLCPGPLQLPPQRCRAEFPGSSASPPKGYHSAAEVQGTAGTAAAAPDCPWEQARIPAWTRRPGIRGGPGQGPPRKRRVQPLAFGHAGWGPWAP